MADDYIEKVKAGLPPFLAYDYDPPAIHSRKVEINHTFERYVRVNVVKNSKGYNTDCTVSVKSTAPQSDIRQEIADLLILAAEQAEQEIVRQQLEQYEKEIENGS